ncbi:MAG: hypothetical protein DRP65_04110 [Planctomycetota bacterium]|nr:MAG: hypothetical protein DRP65_04110 [Planctomycetota bacterium]
MRKTIEDIAAEDGRYNAEALKFVYEGLGATIRKIKEAADEDQPRHISGAELSKGLAELAIERWGRLSRMVLNRWGVSTTRDLGEIVYLMINHKWMTAQETDTIEDFDNVFDFEEVFEKQFKFNLQ